MGVLIINTVRSDLSRDLSGFAPKRTGPEMADSTIAVPFSCIDRSAEKLSAARRQKEAEEQAARRRAYFRKLECEAQAGQESGDRLTRLTKPPDASSLE